MLKKRQNEVKRNIFLFDEVKKNIAGQLLTHNSKNFHWLNTKLDLERTMNGLGKPFRKKSDPKNWKNSKNQSEIAACEQKTTSEKANFCSNTVFSLYLNLEQKNFTPQNHSLFRCISCFGVTKITTPIDFKNHENVWTDLKKKTAPQYNSNSLNCKK